MAIRTMTNNPSKLITLSNYKGKNSIPLFYVWFHKNTKKKSNIWFAMKNIKSNQI